MARLLEFFGPALHWNRALWSIGTSLSLREVLEASEAEHSGILGPDSLKAAVSTCVRLITRDGGVPAQQRDILQQALNATGSRSELRFGGLEYHVIQQVLADINEHYLARWADALTNPSNSYGPERTARALASHLLDLGFSGGFLHRWWTYQTKYEKQAVTLPEALRLLASRSSEPARKFEVLIVFPSRLTSATKKGFSVPRQWIDATAVSGWLRANGFSTQNLKQAGGLLLAVTEKDPEAAAEVAAELVNVFAARVLVSLKKEIRPVPLAWVAGTKHPFSINRPSRGVYIGAIHRENRVWVDSEIDELVDPAVELLAPLQSSSPGAAVACGWAAIEALLSEPGTPRVAAGDRMAAIVACSFPRAELTMLSYPDEEIAGPLADRLDATPENRDRAILVAEAIVSGRFPLPSNPAEAAAAARMKAVLENPRHRLMDIQNHVGDAFRRLYRQRNLVLHGGRTSAVALRACLRTAAPLAGAGIDRIVHARYVDRSSPLELAARAKIGLGRAGSGSVASCVDLLGK